MQFGKLSYQPMVLFLCVEMLEDEQHANVKWLPKVAVVLEDSS